ncbi:hypothetical protein B0H15DRAFT_1004636 [Mycena belliarum]|uniref:Uncharacterized protein n=1 Tax=Mycena belliarum TaxID=1033014 RepID=A0AAD6XIC0_9AGAR|nr:hypothetical protein B0H15DRAFT_1004636 [Mycena belliae]
MAPTPSIQLTADCQAVVYFASRAIESLPCLRCTLIGLSAVLAVAFLIWVALPARLCKTMDACFDTTERLYHGSIVTGLLTPCFDPEAFELLRSLQRRVSHIHERRLRSSLRPWHEMRDILTGHSFIIFRCIWDIKVLKNRIEVQREIRLRELADAFACGEGGSSHNMLANSDSLT